jgi:hypothetical protein
MATKTKDNNQCTSVYTSKLQDSKEKFSDFGTVKQIESQKYTAKLTTTLRPSVKIYEIPLFSISATIYDSLPIFPEVNILPILGKNDRIKILLNSGIGDYRLDPIVIEPGDNSIYENIRSALNLEPGSPLPYRSDDPPAKFEIFRTTTHPSKYTDFSGHLTQVIDNKLSSGYKYLSSNTFIDRVESNTKYYYTFRTLDLHGNISNPSPIYKIELVDDDGTTYLLVEVVEFIKKEKTQISKDMRKLFNIVPRMSQCIVNGEDIKDYSTARGASSPLVGFERETLWGKKFKIRLISKKTGKKMDLNVNFQTEMMSEEIK